jgi:predicted acyl esterase
VLPAEEDWVVSSVDGARLHAVVWRPDTAAEPDWKAPIVLVDTPYRMTSDRRDATNPAEPMFLDRYDWLIHELVPRGYAVVYKEVRGTGESGGCLEQTAPTQRQDGYDSVEHFAAKAWSNGKVGMFGKSYLAETQYGAAVLQPPSLVTIVPVASVSGQYEWNLYDGVPFTMQTLLGNVFYFVGSGLEPGTTPGGIANYPSHYECQARMLAAGADMSGDWTEYWAERELRDHFHNITASVLYVHGFQDWNVRQVAIRDAWERIQSEKRLLLGQWAHDFPEANAYKAEWSRDDWRPMVHAWYDHYLLGIQNGILDLLPPVQVQDSRGAWRFEQEYPPADVAWQAFHLGEGSLSLAPPEQAVSLAWRENTESFLRGLAIPVRDQATPQATKLVFTSEPLDHDLRFSGWPVLHFTTTLTDGLHPDPDSVIDAHFAANLEVAGCDAAGWINQGYLSARHRDGVRDPKPVIEGEAVEYTLRLSPADTVVPSGCSLVLTLAGSDAITQPEGSFWAGVLSGGRLEFPTVQRDLSKVGLAVEMGRPA